VYEHPSCGDSLLNVVMSPGGHEEQQGDDGVDGENKEIEETEDHKQH
jgi:hypothetical protein